MRLGAIHSTKVAKKNDSVKCNYPIYVSFGVML